MKKKSWVMDALIGLTLTLFAVGAYALKDSFPLLESLELKTYDLRAKFRQNLDPSQDIVIIAIDEDSIARLGRWPWPRTRLAEMITLLAKAKPKVIGLDILLSEPERNPALEELSQLQSRYSELVSSRKVAQRRGVQFQDEFSQAAARLDSDSHLLAALTAAQSVALPMFFSEGGTVGGKPAPLPPALSSSTLSARASALPAEFLPPEGGRLVAPVPAFLEASVGVGHVNIYPDLDGVVRREVPAVKYGDQYIPSFALQLTARYLGFSSREIKITPGKSIELGKKRIPLDDGQSMLVTFNGPDRTFRDYSFHEVLNGKVEMDVFKDKIVIVGPSAAGVATLYVTPVARSLPSVEFIANVIENILDQRFLVRPVWAVQAELGMIAFCGLFIMLVLPRLKALGGAMATTLLMGVILGGGFYLFQNGGEWIKVVYPAFILGAGYLVIVTKRFLVTERGKELVEASAIETNKMLGLSFQGQGMLDLAFEKFRLCPLDDAMMDTLYNLGLDFERKRQYAKAVSAYKHIAAKAAGFKDIQAKIKTLSAAAEGAVFGGLGGKSAEGTVLVADGATKPKLGRYEIERELGRGAMGIVYLGKDPKINRSVAIKTLTLETGSTPDETRQIKERFFREAESAGTLNHPAIVRIYDAGEEQDICYIAMELLDGQDLAAFTVSGKLLPPEVAMEYVAKVAEGLDYAHAQGIVHRDIKPANIMLLKDGTVRVADFGIARITASSKTATGTVMGTPSYMSPEQIAGKKVDGRSDLFSLGVALFEFLTGSKPFKGGDGIGTLLFQIANDPEPDPRSINSALPAGISGIIHKALKKDPDERYQRGSELAADLRSCISAMKGGAPPAAAMPEAGSLLPTAEEIASSLTIGGSLAHAPGSEDKIVEAPADPSVQTVAADLDAILPQINPDETIKLSDPGGKA